MSWLEFCDKDGNLSYPRNSAPALVFLSGDRTINAERLDDQPWGIDLGWFDEDKGYWRVHGAPSRYVTHWQYLPRPPREARG